MVNPDRANFDAAFSLAYDELRRLARQIIRSKGVCDLSATTLVNEAWLKLSSSAPTPSDRLHFRRIVGQAMRFILVDASRRKASKIRGGSEILVTFDESLDADRNFHIGPEFLVLDAALNTLASVAPRQAQLLEARFFGGLTAEEMVEIFGISQSTVVRELRMAKALG
jgi:RNA polymerase sigma factor (TIGR02999 family)